MMDGLMKELQGLLDSYVEREMLPSASLGVVYGNHLYSCHSGYRQIVPNKETLKSDTIYDLASLSKVVGTLPMVLKLMEEGALSLSDSVQSHLPDFPYEHISINHLLVHTSGLAADDKNYRMCKNKEEIRDFINRLPLEYPTGTKVVYSCFNYILLGFVIEKLRGSLDAFSQKEVFEPFDLKRTAYLPSEKGWKYECAATEISEARGVIQGVVHDGKAFIIGGEAGNAGVFSTVDDLSHLAVLILNDGIYQKRRIFKSETIDLLKHCYTTGLNERRTLGWYVNDPSCSYGDHYSEHCLYHTGFTGTSMYIDFDRQCAVILLTNRVHPSRANAHIQKIRKDIHNRILEGIDAIERG